jgi:hypothetical protein
MFMVLPAAFGVFGYEVTGRTDPGIRAFTTGRNEPQFYSTLGLFLNLVPYRHQPGRELPRDRGDHQPHVQHRRVRRADGDWLDRGM